jgi:hypothetical protein
MFTSGYHTFPLNLRWVHPPRRPRQDRCREAIEDTKVSEPKCDLQMARILAEAREKAQQEAGWGWGYAVFIVGRHG